MTDSLGHTTASHAKMFCLFVCLFGWLAGWLFFCLVDWLVWFDFIFEFSLGEVAGHLVEVRGWGCEWNREK